MALIPGLNYVESNIIDQLLSLPAQTNTDNATLFIGTARSGQTRQLTRVTSQTAKTLFGEVPRGADFDTNAVHAVLATQASTANRDKETYIYKVGDSSVGRLSLFENQVFSSGDPSYSLTDDGLPVIAMQFDSLEEKEDANRTTVRIKGDASGLPQSMIVTLPDGYNRAFAIDPYGVRPGIPANVRDLTAAILTDARLANELNVTYNVLRKTNLQTTVLGTAAKPYMQIDAVGANNSWGDKLLNIEKIVQLVTQTDSIAAGSTVAQLTYGPDKSTNEAVPSITAFVKIVTEEVAVVGAPSNIGDLQFTRTLSFVSPSMHWDADISTITNSLVLKYLRGGVKTDIPNTAWSFDVDNDIVIDLTGVLPADPNGIQQDDKILASYEFGASFTEAKSRTQLELGNEHMYFVAGRNVTFGNAPSLPLKVTYDATKEFALSDLAIEDFANIKISFINANTMPAPGAQVYMTFTYLPELPAPSATAINKVVSGSPVFYQNQKSALEGATSGSLITKKRYKELVMQALDDTLLTPFRRVMVSGAWADDFVNDIDDETGFPGLINLNWLGDLEDKLILKSQVTSECSSVIGVKPIDVTLLQQGTVGVNKWYDYLVGDVTDANTAAGVMNAFAGYHIDIALGAPQVADSSILNGATYIENPAYVVCGMQLDNTLTQSLIKNQVPPFVKNLAVTFPSGGIIGKLNSSKYTTIVQSPRGDFRIADAPTGDNPNKSMARQIVRDTVFAAIKVARDIATTFIGDRRDARTLGLMKSKIDNEVSRAMVPEFLTRFQVEIVPVNGGFVTGETKLRLMVETTVEIRRVYFETTVTLGGQEL